MKTYFIVAIALIAPASTLLADVNISPLPEDIGDSKAVIDQNFTNLKIFSEALEDAIAQKSTQQSTEDIANATVLAIGTHYYGDLSASKSLNGIAGEPQNLDSIEWSGTVTNGPVSFNFGLHVNRLSTNGTTDTIEYQSGHAEWSMLHLNGQWWLADNGTVDDLENGGGTINIDGEEVDQPNFSSSGDVGFVSTESGISAVLNPTGIAPGSYTSITKLTIGLDGRVTNIEGVLLDETAPSPIDAIIDSSGSNLIITFSEPVTAGPNGTGGVSYEAQAAGPGEGAYISGLGTTTIIYDLGKTITETDAVNWSYLQPGEGIEDLSGNDLESISDYPATNESTVPDPVPISGYLAHHTGTSNPTSGTNTFTSIDFGSEDPERLVVVGLLRREGGTASNMIIGGVAATKIGDTQLNTNASTAKFSTEFWQAPVPTNSDNSISYTASSTGDWSYVAVWNLTGASHLPLDFGGANGTTQPYATLSTAKGGFAVAIIAGNEPNFEFSPQGELSEHFDLNPGNLDGVGAAAKSTEQDATENIQINVTGSTLAGFVSFSSATFQPSTE